MNVCVLLGDVFRLARFAERQVLELALARVSSWYVGSICGPRA
jgi:hypothetical protein